MMVHIRRGLSLRWEKTVGIAAMLVVVCGGRLQASAQEQKSPYPAMAPIQQYLSQDKQTEIALARSAAPASISGDADVLALGQDGYTTAMKGSNC
jgi:hypothetical protein